MSEDDKKPVATQDDETAWILAFVGGDRSAFDRLVLKHQNCVFNLCYRLLGDYEDANDCAQETFVKVYNSLKDFRFGSSFSTWLYAIAVNTCRNKLKSAEYRRRKKMVAIDDPPAPSNERNSTLELEDPSPSALTRLVAKERDRLVQDAIHELPEEARTVVVLRDVHGLSYEEIVRATGYHLGTVKSKLARARMQLRERLKGVV